MATSRRVFLNVLGGAAASSAVNLGCGGTLDDGIAGRGDAAPRFEGGAAGVDPGATQTGGSAGAGSGGAGGNGGASGGAAGSPRADGAAGRPFDAGVDARGTSGAAGRAVPDAATVAEASTGGTGPAPIAGSPVLSFGDRPAGLIRDYANPSLRAFAVDFIAVGRDANGLYAMSIVCTHQGCTLNNPTTAGQFSCPCHGSRFDRNGAVVNGPATQPLEHYGVEIDGAGNVIVHTMIRATAAARTPVV